MKNTKFSPKWYIPEKKYFKEIPVGFKIPQSSVPLEKGKYDAPRFTGLISSSMEPYLERYAEGEERKLREAIDKYIPANKFEMMGIFFFIY